MRTEPVRMRLRRGKAFLAVVGVLAFLAVAGFAAYKIFFNRPGEAAAMYIPADADMVITLDTNPSERQALTFKKITEKLEEEGIAKKIDEALKGFMDGQPVAAELRPHLSRSFAMGMWMKDGGQQEVVTLCAVDDPGAVRSILEKNGQSKSGGIFALGKSSSDTQAMVIDNYLAISNKPEALARLEAVRSGAQPAVARTAEFIAARESLPKDANVMVFLSPRMFDRLGKGQGTPGVGTMGGMKWMAYGLTVEPEGLALDFHCPMDSGQLKALKALSGTQPFRWDALKSLPEGAYGVVGYSQAGRYWDLVSESVGKEVSLRVEFEKGIQEFESKTGLSVSKDIVPAFNGEQVLAVYPGPSGAKEDLDLVLMLTDANGANPGELAIKVRHLIERKSAEEKSPVKFVESQIGDVTVWEIDPSARKEMADGIAKEFYGSDRGRVAPRPGEGGPGIPDMSTGQPPVFAQEQPVPAEPPKPAEKPAFLKDKTIIYAQFGNAVIVTSSKALLNRTIDSRNSGKSLADDPAFASMATKVVPSSQTLMLVNLRRVMDALRPMFDENLKDAPVTADDIVNLFGTGDVGLVASGKYEGEVSTGRVLIPLDFERIIHMIGEGMRASESLAGPPEVTFEIPRTETASR